MFTISHKKPISNHGLPPHLVLPSGNAFLLAVASVLTRTLIFVLVPTFFMTYGKQPAANTTLQHVLSLSCGLGMTCVLIAYSSLWWPKITQPSLCTPTSSWFFRGLYVPSTRPFCFTVPIHKRGLRRTHLWSAREDNFDQISLSMKRCGLGITTIAFRWIM